MARWNHKSVYSKKYHGMIVHGGRNNNYEHQFFCDLWFFYIEHQIWQEVKFNIIDNVPRRAGHCLETYDGNLLIFGGFNDEGYLRSDIHLISLEEKKPSKNDLSRFKSGLSLNPEIREEANDGTRFAAINNQYRITSP